MNGDHVMSKYMHKVRDMYIFTRCADVIKNSCNMSNLLQGSVAVTAEKHKTKCAAELGAQGTTPFFSERTHIEDE